MEIRFKKTAPDRCPAFRDFYILDRVSGRDIYGHETYQYALYRKNSFHAIRRFRTRRQAYEYLTQKTGLTRLDVKWRSRSIVVNDRDHLGVLHDGTLYRMNKKTREIDSRPLEDEQITGWFDRYADCVAESKEIIKKMEGV